MRLIWLLPFCASLSFANVEKTIFTAPEPPVEDSQLPQVNLETLSPSVPTIRRYLEASFPSDEAPTGTGTWFRLTDLVPGKRYEVRVCWLATQPTAFTLSTHTPSRVFNSPSLLASLATFADQKPQVNQVVPDSIQADSASSSSGVTLFLLIHAAADYFTLDDKLMRDVPPVHVDLILDPYILNILPRSLLPTVIYILFVAVIGWYISQYIYATLSKVAEGADIDPEFLKLYYDVRETGEKDRHAKEGGGSLLENESQNEQPVKSGGIGFSRKKADRVGFFSL
ncbi:hypothetical protein FQN57_003357 [Myotisia sp. PD_48]|nr:hypothetical protein FQN57_003357 [Myotisia sp. PD_48]